ncbi:hypothetical protein FQR65_LT06947 [Abscondita terminalis]|nr:hypothetical protein FQR65_LT06947 [Abscondita terminalis]
MSRHHGEDFFRYEKLILKYTGIWRTNDDGLAYKIYSSVVIAMSTYVYIIILTFDALTQNFYDGTDSWVVFVGFGIATINLETCYKKWKKIISFATFIETIVVITYTTTITIIIGLQIAYTLTLRYTKPDPNEWKLGYGSISVVNVKYSPVFEIFCVYQHLAIFYTGISAAIIFTTIVGTLNFIATQLIILQNDIKTVVLDDNKHLVDNEKLKIFVNNHVRLQKLTNKVSASYSKTILVTFLGVMSTNCLSIYLMSVVLKTTAICHDYYIEIFQLPVKDLSSVTLFLEVFQFYL